MQLNTKKSFLKLYNKLQNKDKDKIDESLRLFIKNPNNKKLRNHSVDPKFPNCRSINAGFDLRIILREEKETYQIVSLIRLWTHSELYG